MGFGLLFTGYISFFCLRLVPCDIFGFLMLFLGFKKLSIYNKSFKNAKNISVVCLIYSIIYGVYWAFCNFGVINVKLIPTEISFIENLFYYSLLFLLHLNMYKGIKDIAVFCDFDKASRKAVRCISTASVYYVFTFIFYILKSLPIKSENFVNILNPLFLALNLLMLLWLFMSASLIFSCYSNLVTDEILEDEKAKVQKFNEKFGRKPKK